MVKYLLHVDSRYNICFCSRGVNLVGYILSEVWVISLTLYCSFACEGNIYIVAVWCNSVIRGNTAIFN